MVFASMPFGKARLLKLVEGPALPGFTEEWGVRTWPQLFLKWVLGDPAVTVILTGTRSAAHASENLEAASGHVPDASQRKAIADWFARL